MINIRLPGIGVLLFFVSLAGISVASESLQDVPISVSVVDAVQVEQLGITNAEDLINTLPHSNLGTLKVNKYRLRGLNQEASYVHAVIDGVPVAMNLPVGETNSPPTDRVHALIPLNVTLGTHLGQLDMNVMMSTEPVSSSALLDYYNSESQPISFNVGDRNTTYGDQSLPDLSMLGNLPGGIQADRHLWIESVVNPNALPEANFASSASNMFLNLIGENGNAKEKLTQILDELSDDEFDPFGSSIADLATFISDSGLRENFFLSHWGRDGDTDILSDEGLVFSKGLGPDITLDDLTARLAEGESCFAGISYEGGVQYANIVSLGQTLGNPYIGYSFDFDRSSDSAGAFSEGLFHSNLSDRDADGYYNVDGRDSEWDIAVCLRYKEDSVLTGPVVPPGEDIYVVEDAEVEITGTFGNVSHFFVGGSYPTKLKFTFVDDELEVDSDARTYFPQIASIQPDGTFEGTGSTTFAGFNNVSWKLTGEIHDRGLEATYQVGLSMELPGGNSAAVRYEYALEEGSTWGWQTMTQALPGPTLAIRVNGFRRDYEIGEGEPFGVSYLFTNTSRYARELHELYNEDHVSYDESQLDYWIPARVGETEFYSFDANTGNYLPGLTPTFVGAPMDVTWTDLLYVPDGVTPLEVDFFMAIDPAGNGVDLNAVIWDQLRFKAAAKQAADF